MYVLSSEWHVHLDNCELYFPGFSREICCFSSLCSIGRGVVHDLSVFSINSTILFVKVISEIIRFVK